MDLQLGLSLPTLSTSSASDSDHLSPHSLRKRSFSDLLHHGRLRDDNHHHDVGLLPTLPLLPLTPTREADNLDDDLHTSCSIVTKNDGDDGGESAAVGWPPIMSQRKKRQFEGDGMVGIRHKRGSVDPLRESEALYVKVTMEGEGIGRKIDLSLHHSFHKLKETLIAMFGKCHRHSDCYLLVYQDSDGDWLLAEDLPWKFFPLLSVIFPMQIICT
ncbi:auxin-responsive protein IAA20-like isoform X1 [Prosopis cineraria]|uniref:auxin-responsive protein IAA20-like isoform X1 n=1 Tax=Prosopis cineraria TaxID=364024 RepID=UPI00240F52E2|nr:auxin-responsive protein IAA20-like isoform X1 [Prosopis cineraria]XP_054820399.1 auxin-responsive protein IAA20-like isoform X1 [Prosopis cineraria]